MSNIHNYPLTANQINDEDFYDVDFWNGLTYETRKISGLTLKTILGGANVLNDLGDVSTGLPVSPTNADDGRVLHFDINSGEWISDDIANISNVVKNCKTSILTGSIPKGTPVYLAGYDNDLIVVEAADSSDPNKMPAIGIAAENLDDTNPKKVVSFGKIQGLDTSLFSQGDVLYVGNGGGLTPTRPIGTSEIQRVAQILKSDNPGGVLKVFNTSRTAGLPNLADGKIWIGDVNGYPVQIDLPAGGTEMVYSEYAYNMSTAGGFTWNGNTVGATSLTTLLQRWRLQAFVGIGNPDGCFTNFVLPTNYVAGTNIRVTMKITCGSSGNTFWGCGLGKIGIVGDYGGETETEWLTNTHTFLNGFLDEEIVFIFNGATLTPSEPISVMIYRDPGNPNDVNTADAYLNQILVETI